MLNLLVKGYLATMAVKLLNNYRHLSAQFLQIEATKSYLHGVRLARLLTLRLLWMGLIISLICFGVMLIHVGIFLLLPCPLETKVLLGLILGLFYTVTGIVLLIVCMDEKRWMKQSGATAMLQEATRQNPTLNT
jgi:hypothetical protein